MPIIIDDVQTEVIEEQPEPAAGQEADGSAEGQDPLSPLLKLRRLNDRLRERRARLAAN